MPKIEAIINRTHNYTQNVSANAPKRYQKSHPYYNQIQIALQKHLEKEGVIPITMHFSE